MSDYTSKSALIEALKQEIRLITPIEENHDMFYHDSGYNCAMVVARLLAEKLPTLSETEIIRKAFERVVERLEHQAGEFIDLSHRELCSISIHAIKYLNKGLGVARAIEIVKEECGISE